METSANPCALALCEPRKWHTDFKTLFIALHCLSWMKNMHGDLQQNCPSPVGGHRWLPVFKVWDLYCRISIAKYWRHRVLSLCEKSDGSLLSREWVTVVGLRVEEMLAGGTNRNLWRKCIPRSAVSSLPDTAPFTLSSIFKEGEKKPSKEMLKTNIGGQLATWTPSQERGSDLCLERPVEVLCISWSYDLHLKNPPHHSWGRQSQAAGEHMAVSLKLLHYKSQVETTQRPLNLPQQRGFGRQVHMLTLCCLPQRISLSVLMRPQALHMLGEGSNAEWHPQPYLLHI